MGSSSHQMVVFPGGISRCNIKIGSTTFPVPGKLPPDLAAVKFYARSATTHTAGPRVGLRGLSRKHKVWSLSV